MADYEDNENVREEIITNFDGDPLTSGEKVEYNDGRTEVNGNHPENKE